jgi:hypothetical protein
VTKHVENTTLWLITKAKHELPLTVFEGANRCRKELEERIDHRGSLLVSRKVHLRLLVMKQRQSMSANKSRKEQQEQRVCKEGVFYMISFVC